MVLFYCISDQINAVLVSNPKLLNSSNIKKCKNISSKIESNYCNIKKRMDGWMDGWWMKGTSTQVYMFLVVSDSLWWGKHLLYQPAVHLHALWKSDHGTCTQTPSFTLVHIHIVCLHIHMHTHTLTQLTNHKSLSFSLIYYFIFAPSSTSLHKINMHHSS